jgi:2-C-methyl-D-erythritol 4-phosphate cytidylyltransferase
MANNIFGIILAGGQGTRMGNAERPKQFMEIGKREIFHMPSIKCNI